MNLKDYLAAKRSLVEGHLKSLLKTNGPLENHIKAMNYSLLAGGKRLRPVLMLATIEALGKDPKSFLPAASALECIHTYSLIHDDLPAMDDDDLRRGKPTNHKVYGEAEAILAGDGLLTFAFELLTEDMSDTLSAADQLGMIRVLSKAGGSFGMVGGQALDLASECKKISYDTLKFIHSHKTGALITAAVQMGAIAGEADEDQYQSLTLYGQKIGLAFQIVDDLLNVTGSEEELGKAIGSDADRQKATYPSLFGLEKTGEMVEKNVADAVQALAEFDSLAEPLRQLAEYVLTRRR